MFIALSAFYALNHLIFTILGSRHIMNPYFTTEEIGAKKNIKGNVNSII